MSIVVRLTLALAAFALAGCAPAPCIKPAPQIVKVTVKEYVPVPAEFTAPCPIEMPQNPLVKEAVRVASMRRDALEGCNRQLDKIRKLQSPSDSTKP